MKLMKTYSPKKSDFDNKQWYLVDANGKTLGRIATEIAVRLRGKNKVEYAPHVDCGDFVVVINAERIKVTGNKEEQKMYYRHSGYPGGFKSEVLKDTREKRPDHIITHAVAGMIPRNKLKKIVMKRLKVYAGNDHPHEAQQPTLINL